MENINPSNNVNRRGRFYSVMGVFVFLGGLLSIAMGILFIFLPLLGSSLSQPAAFCLAGVGIPMTLGGMFGIYRGLTLQKDNPVARDIGEAMRPYLGSDPVIPIFATLVAVIWAILMLSLLALPVC